MRNNTTPTRWLLIGLSVTVIFIISLRPAEGNIGYGVLGCWRDHPDTKSSYASAIAKINSYVDGGVKAPGDVLRTVSQVIWPTEDVLPDAMYCFDEEIHGSIPPNVRRNFSSILDGFREGVDAALAIIDRNPRDPSLENALKRIGTNMTFFSRAFLQVTEIEQGSLYLREFAALWMGAHAELINFYRASRDTVMMNRWREWMENRCYVLAKYSYWFQRYMPKKMADNIVFDVLKFGNNQLGFVNQINAKRLNEYDEILAKCAANDNNACSDYALGFLKSVRISSRRKIEEYWKDILKDFRKLLFLRHCKQPDCQKDRYPELYIRLGEPLGLQFQASNSEGGKFCGKDFCTNMWMSTAGYHDYIYYRQCLGDNPIELPCDRCLDDLWTICTKAGGCDRNTILTNDHYPVALRSRAMGTCIDCSTIGTWCKQGTCPVYTQDGSDNVAVDECSDGPEHCRGAQFQVQNFERGAKEPLEILDEVHFSYASPKAGSPKFLTGDIYSGAFLRTQYYLRLEDKFSVNSKKTGATSGPYTCVVGNTWSMMNDDQRAACAQSSFTLFKKLDPEHFLFDQPAGREEGPVDRDRQNQNLGGGARELAGDDAPYADHVEECVASGASRNRI